ncbi:MAG TPA: HAMP domain-containing sensor histidine kinase [Hyphomicrobiaceae bacterium]|nr:HAMP domain-containing sensor histidine kinase [Hyphomicrobiaceae bacterium]
MDARVERGGSEDAGAASAVRRGVLAGVVDRLRRPGLSTKLLRLTVLFVMLAEVLIFVPSIAKFRLDWLNDRLKSAHLASLALEAVPGGQVPATLRKELLEGARVRAVAVRRADQRLLVLPADGPIIVDRTYNLAEMQPAGSTSPVVSGRRIEAAYDALITYFLASETYIRIIGHSGMAASPERDVIDVVLPVGPLKSAMIQFGLNILALSIVISIITAGLIFLVLDRLLVRPIMNIADNVVRFAANPEDQQAFIKPSGRNDEIGTAEHEIRRMQQELSQVIHQKSRLAALGLAMSKINHDLRNMLANAQLISDRLTTLPDPTVQQFAPKLIASLDRAINFANSTLHYGRAEEAVPKRERLALKEFAREVGEGLGLPRAQVAFEVEMPDDLVIDADPDQLFRILTNIMRNSIQAIEAEAQVRNRIVIGGRREGPMVTLSIADDGPGVPAKARAHLFQAFQGSTRKGGTGLGLAIVMELVAAHGGRISLRDDVPKGATFDIEIPDRAG